MDIVAYLSTLPGWWALLLIFSLLFICGLGFPMSEELPLLATGYLAYRGVFSLESGMLVCFVGVMVGDLILFTVGSWFGLKLFEIRWFRKFMNRKRLRMSRYVFSRYGNKVVFFARFVSGLRAPVFVSAAILRMPIRKFLLIDGLAALISVPTSIWLVWYFGAEIEAAGRWLARTKFVVLSIVGIIITVWVVYRPWRRKVLKSLEAKVFGEQSSGNQRSGEGACSSPKSMAPPTDERV